LRWLESVTIRQPGEQLLDIGAGPGTGPLILGRPARGSREKVMDESPLASGGFVAGPGVGKPLDVGDMQMSLKASAQQTQGVLSLFETEDLPGFSPPPHFHTDTAESFYVLEGEYEVSIGREAFVCGPGSFVHVPPGVPHGFTVGAKRARKLMIFVPGAMESYFEELDAAVRAGPVSAELVAAIALRANMVVLDPPRGYASGMSG
jgi:quercetin dioxygenase-like cupin family protein